ncbi:MAG: hypothetical protein P8N02_11735 [Actinomycetota bacterium]|nr:hypothetical protein [Actinomycetota bacterium]
MAIVLSAPELLGHAERRLASVGCLAEPPDLTAHQGVGVVVDADLGEADRAARHVEQLHHRFAVGLTRAEGHGERADELAQRFGQVVDEPRLGRMIDAHDATAEHAAQTNS